MSPLRRQMIQLMERENYSPHTIDAYVQIVNHFARHFGECPSLLGDQQIAEYLHFKTKTDPKSKATCQLIYSGLRFFYIRVLDKEWNEKKIKRPRSVQRLPEILSRSEVKAVIEAANNRKHRMMFMLLYSAGLRIGELVNLKAKDIDSKRMLIRIEQGKGNKDRYTMLSPLVLNELRLYWLQFRPKEWLFAGMKADNPIQTRSVLLAFHQSRKRAGITKSVVLHSLRHSFATHMLEDGVAISTIQALLGHADIRTTSLYLHVQGEYLRTLTNPLDQLMT